MKSYASVDRIEGKFAVCEVEMVEVVDSKIIDFFDKKTVMSDVPLEMISQNVESIREGDILIVEHDEEDVSFIYSKDDEERARRVEYIRQLQN